MYVSKKLEESTSGCLNPLGDTTKRITRTPDIQAPLLFYFCVHVCV